MSKKQLATKQQLDYIFSEPLFKSNATVSYKQLPKGFDVLGISVDRGGKAKFNKVNISYFGDDNKRVLGVETWDDVVKILKEDIREYDRNRSIVTIYPKGEYEKVNPLYRNTHHKTIK